MDIYERVENLLKENGHRLTKQRRIFLETFVENPDKHLKPEDVHRLIVSKDDSVGIATVYRNIQLFEKLGIIDKVNFEDGFVRYEFNGCESSHHHHFICRDCGEVIEIPSNNVGKWEKEISEKYNVEIVDHSMKFFGYCEDCK